LHEKGETFLEDGEIHNTENTDSWFKKEDGKEGYDIPGVIP
jgi:hypothetical protein